MVTIGTSLSESGFQTWPDRGEPEVVAYHRHFSRPLCGIISPRQMRKHRGLLLLWIGSGPFAVPLLLSFPLRLLDIFLSVELLVLTFFPLAVPVLAWVVIARLRPGFDKGWWDSIQWAILSAILMPVIVIGVMTLFPPTTQSAAHSFEFIGYILIGLYLAITTPLCFLLPRIVFRQLRPGAFPGKRTGDAG